MAKVFHTEKVYIIQMRSWLKKAGWDAEFIDNLDTRQLAAIADQYGYLRRQSREVDLIKAASAVMGDLMRG